MVSETAAAVLPSHSWFGSSTPALNLESSMFHLELMNPSIFPGQDCVTPLSRRWKSFQHLKQPSLLTWQIPGSTLLLVGGKDEFNALSSEGFLGAELEYFLLQTHLFLTEVERLILYFYLAYFERLDAHLSELPNNEMRETLVYLFLPCCCSWNLFLSVLPKNVKHFWFCLNTWS